MTSLSEEGVQGRPSTTCTVHASTPWQRDCSRRQPQPRRLKGGLTLAELACGGRTRVPSTAPAGAGADQRSHDVAASALAAHTTDSIATAQQPPPMLEPSQAEAFLDEQLQQQLPEQIQQQQHQQREPAPLGVLPLSNQTENSPTQLFDLPHPLQPSVLRPLPSDETLQQTQQQEECSLQQPVQPRGMQPAQQPMSEIQHHPPREQQTEQQPQRGGEPQEQAQAPVLVEDMILTCRRRHTAARVSPRRRKRRKQRPRPCRCDTDGAEADQQLRTYVTRFRGAPRARTVPRSSVVCQHNLFCNLMI